MSTAETGESTAAISKRMDEWAAPALRMSHERGELPTDPLLLKGPA